MAATGGPAVDFITHAFLQFRNASVPVPRVALVDFSKAHNLSAGDDRTVELVAVSYTHLTLPTILLV